MRDGLLLVAHGSRSAAGQAETAVLAEGVAAALPGVAVELGYLELSDPPAGAALDRLVARGVQRVVALPLMLHAAGHARSDVPAVVLEGRARHPEVAVVYGRPFGVDHVLVEVAAARIDAVGGRGLPLALLSRGTSDPDANGEAYKAGRLLAEHVGAPVVQVGFSGVTWPSVPDALDQLRRLGAHRIVAFAWFLATGVLIDRMGVQFAAFADAHGVEVLDAGYFGAGPELVGLVLDRYAEALAGDVRANCDTCAYRRPFPGLEARVGQSIGVGHSHLALEHRHAHH